MGRAWRGRTGSNGGARDSRSKTEYTETGIAVNIPNETTTTTTTTTELHEVIRIFLLLQDFLPSKIFRTLSVQGFFGAGVSFS